MSENRIASRYTLRLPGPLRSVWQFFYLHMRDQNEKMQGVPDALLYLRGKDRESKAALELELTSKNRTRLFRKLESQMITSDFDFIFYVVGGEHLMKPLWSAYTEVLAKSFKVKLHKKLNGVFFADLGAVKKEGLEAKFKGLHDSFSFSDLSK